MQLVVKLAGNVVDILAARADDDRGRAEQALETNARWLRILVTLDAQREPIRQILLSGGSRTVKGGDRRAEDDRRRRRCRGERARHGRRNESTEVCPDLDRGDLPRRASALGEGAQRGERGGIGIRKEEPREPADLLAVDVDTSRTGGRGDTHVSPPPRSVRPAIQSRAA
jgi:hypothetical protein